ncbi:MAG: HD domain-containing protein [Planctomycetaceae bacterium]|nr:HD domain-containing protein [Planctomycetaceae bacterium]
MIDKRPVPQSEVIDFLINLFQDRGDTLYAGEPVSQTEHALQAATFAENENAPASLIAAALLHDVGHLLTTLPEDCAEQGIDSEHESLGAEWLEHYFGPEVTEPIRLHVAAKRYRCAVDPDYYANLSDASRLSLKLQGGPFSLEEINEFDQSPQASAALQLRLWDEAAKIRDYATPSLSHFRPYLESSLRKS